MNPMSPSSSSSPRWDGPASVLGGLLWLVSYGVDLFVGVTTGQMVSDPTSSPIALLGSLSFLAGTLAIDMGLVGLGLRLPRPMSMTGRVGFAFACLSATCAAIALALMVLGGLLPQVPLPPFAVTGVLGGCVGVTLLGLASRRAGTQPPRVSALLPWMGALHVGLLVLSFFTPGGTPEYVMNNMPFAVSGSVWCYLGILRSRAPAPDATPSSVRS